MSQLDKNEASEYWKIRFYCNQIWSLVTVLFSNRRSCLGIFVECVLFIRVYLVVIDIRIVDCHMYPGEPCPQSLVLSYIPAEASMQSNPQHYMHLFFLQWQCWISRSCLICQIFIPLCWIKNPLIIMLVTLIIGVAIVRTRWNYRECNNYFSPYIFSSAISVVLLKFGLGLLPCN